ncbi:MAG: 3'-5' exonuclease domain-containing protein 2 [Paludibacter sp.]|nr:3'-5' exonuclease domain-containing protein 2 [Paludibacter sp.]
MFKTKITKEEVNLLPLIVFEGKITLVDDISMVQSAINELRKSKVVGIDTETKPSFTRGTHYKVSLVQISTLDHCFLFRLNKIGFPPELSEFLADEKVKKIGLSLRDDLSGLNKHQKFNPGNFVDIQTIAQNYGILELSLQKIYAILFEKKISKSQRLSNWENPELSELQQRYAATDAWTSLQIYLQLMKENKLTKKQIQKIVMQDTMEQREKQAQRMLQNKPEEIQTSNPEL